MYKVPYFHEIMTYIVQYVVFQVISLRKSWSASGNRTILNHSSTSTILKNIVFDDRTFFDCLCNDTYVLLHKQSKNVVVLPKSIFCNFVFSVCSNTRVAKINNMQLLEPTLHSLKIKFDAHTAQEIMEEKQGIVQQRNIF